MLVNLCSFWVKQSFTHTPASHSCRLTSTFIFKLFPSVLHPPCYQDCPEIHPFYQIIFSPLTQSCSFWQPTDVWHRPTTILKKSIYFTKSRVDSSVSIVLFPLALFSPAGFSLRWYGFICVSVEKLPTQTTEECDNNEHISCAWTAFSFRLHNNKTNGSWQFHFSSPNHLFCKKLNVHYVVIANKAKCCSKLFHYIHEKFSSESVIINPPDWSFRTTFGPESFQTVERGWLCCRPARFGPDLKAEEKLD